MHIQTYFFVRNADHYVIRITTAVVLPLIIANSPIHPVELWVRDIGEYKIHVQASVSTKQV